MLDAVLAAFPPHTHPLTLASDPDAVLADDELRAALSERGFHLIAEEDPVALRHAVQGAMPFTAVSPVVIVTRGRLNALPYDLWQQGRHVELDLAALFPWLDTAIVRALSPAQRRRLREAQEEPQAPQGAALSRLETIELVLRRVFGFGGDDVLTAAGLLTWLARYHATGEPMPAVLAEQVQARAARSPALRGWPVDELLSDADAYRRFVQSGWEVSLGAQAPSAMGGGFRELPTPYTAGGLPSFVADEALQDALPVLVRTGALRPIALPAAAALPGWARPGLIPVDADQLREQLAAGLGKLERRMEGALERWDDWRDVAGTWAELSDLRYDPRLAPLAAEMTERYERALGALDEAFPRWLAANYALLAGRALPRPHHVFHVPQWLAHRREQGVGAQRPALIVLDGMSLGDWEQIRATWAARHPDWAIDGELVLAQAPTITAVSRLALISGRRPNTFSADQLQNRHEPRLWQEFWAQQGLPAEAAVYAHLADGAEYPHEISSRRTQAICVVITAIDDIVHGATLGAEDVRASLDVWLRGRGGTAGQGSPWLEYLIERLLGEGYTVTVTSDHGHVEALGMGAPREGVLAATRGKRVRLYTSAGLARDAQTRIAGTLVLEGGWLAPSGVYPLVAPDRRAFAAVGERVVTHGGLTLEEMVVPLATIVGK